MTGVKPPDALTRAAAVVNSQPDPLRPASEANPAVAPEVNVVLQKALAQNKDQRYESAAEMRRALHGTDQASTVINRGEAKTVLFPPSVGPVPAETQAIKRQETVSAGETTVVRQRSVAKKRDILFEINANATKKDSVLTDVDLVSERRCVYRQQCDVMAASKEFCRESVVA